MTVTFSNPGLIDLRAVTTMGVSVKDGPSPIGYFGTGLKFAIATILRNSGTVCIWAGTQGYQFGVENDTIRGKDFQLVTMNNVALGFTTALGRNWQPWMAFRELYSNMLDERGQMAFKPARPAPNTTSIEVVCDAIEREARQKHLYFLESEPVYRGKRCEFHSGRTDTFFYRGVRAGKFGSPSCFTINLVEEAALSEDRNLASTFELQRLVTYDLRECNDEAILRQWFTAPRGFVQQSWDLAWNGVSCSPTFLRVGNEVLKSGHPIPDSLIRVLAQHDDRLDPDPVELLHFEKSFIIEAIDFCRRLGYSVDDYKIQVVESLGKNVLGRANRLSNTISLSKTCLAQGKLRIASALIEEWAHLKHDLDDNSTEMQNWLFDQLARLGQAYLEEKEHRND